MSSNTKIERKKISNIKKIILVASGKGGVGKSTIAAGLALALAKEGHSVGLLDADIFGPSVPTLFQLSNAGRPEGVEIDGKKLLMPFEQFGIKIMSIGFFVDASQAVVWRGPMVSNVLRQLLTETHWGNLDYLIVDTPPGTGDIHITLLQEFFVAGAIVVTTAQKMAIDDVKRAIDMLNDDNIGAPIIGLVENMAWFSPAAHPDEKYYLFGKGGAQYLSDEFRIPILAQIPINENVAEFCDSGKINKMLDDTNIAQAYAKLCESIIAQKPVFKFMR